MLKTSDNKINTCYPTKKRIMYNSNLQYFHCKNSELQSGLVCVFIVIRDCVCRRAQNRNRHDKRPFLQARRLSVSVQTLASRSLDHRSRLIRNSLMCSVNYLKTSQDNTRIFYAILDLSQEIHSLAAVD